MKVTKVECISETVQVSFDDGHKAVFEPYAHGVVYQIEGLRQFFLYRGEKLVCEYSARLRRYGEDGNRIVMIVDGYTQQRVAEYWRSARTYINEEYFEKPFNQKKNGPENLRYPWIVTRGGLF